MFTGIIEEVGTVKTIRPDNRAISIGISSFEVIKDLQLGDSVAVNGVCLTVVNNASSIFEVEVGPETIARTTLPYLKIEDKVNLERAIKAGKRIGGHIVTGHVDAVTTLRTIKRLGKASQVYFDIPRGLEVFLAEKGSIALDGVSLTVATIEDATFSVSLIPYTIENTTFSQKKAGSKLNLEVDIFARYVVRALNLTKGNDIDKSLTNFLMGGD